MIRVRVSDVLIIFLNYLLNKWMERLTPLSTDKPLDPESHFHVYRDSIISARTLKTSVTMVVPVLLTLVEAVAGEDGDIVRDFLFMNFSVYTLTNVIKLCSSRPRPYAKDAEKQDFPWNRYFESRKSFPSGHACNGLISGIIAARYLIRAFGLSGASPAGLLIQVPILAIAAAPGVTQAMCHWHHKSDVAAGWALALAYYAAYHTVAPALLCS